jgi:hypothetical protein
MINRHFFFAIFLCNLFFSCSAQHLKNKSYTDFVIADDKIFALTSGGHLDILTTTTYLEVDTGVSGGRPIKKLAVDKNGSIVVIEVNDKLAIFKRKQLTFTPLYSSKNKVYDVVFNKTNIAYLITNKGIEDASTGEVYKPDTSFHLNKQVGGWGRPTTTFTDKNDNIWIGSGFGEWGGELYVFSTVEKKFIKPALNGFEIDLYPVKSIFGGTTAVYISFGLDHMETSGCIMQFTDFKCKPVFTSETHWKKSSDSTQKSVDGEYIGPAAFNAKDNCIYFYSQNGIFRGNIDKNLSEIDSWKKIASPKLHWTYGQRDAVGSPMNVLKMAFAANGKLFLITQSDGIGVYDGKTFQLLN